MSQKHFTLDQSLAEKLNQPGLVASLQRLIDLAQNSDTGGGNVAAQLLLGLYNGPQYPFDLTELCRLDSELYQDALNVIALRVRHSVEPHEFFQNGGELFSNLAEKWQIEAMCDLKERLQS